MAWQDTALMLSVAKQSSSTLLLNILSQNHGRCQCHLNFNPSEVQMMLPGCELDITCLDSDNGKLPEIQVHEVNHGVIVQDHEGPELIVVQCLNDMLSEYLDPDDPNQALFEASIALTRAMEGSDRRWPIKYVIWELALLKALGFTDRFKRCQTEFRHGETIYMSPRTGHVASRLEVGAYVDRMIPVPGLLMGAKSGSLTDVRQALDVLSKLYEQYVSPELHVETVPSVRHKVLVHIEQVKTMPPPEKVQKTAYVSEEDRRRRLLAMRPLMVSARSSRSGSTATT